MINCFRSSALPFLKSIVTKCFTDCMFTWCLPFCIFAIINLMKGVEQLPKTSLCYFYIHGTDQILSSQNGTVRFFVDNEFLPHQFTHVPISERLPEKSFTSKYSCCARI